MRLRPTDEYELSPATVEVKVAAGAFITINYTWSTEDQPQSGMLILSGASDSDEVAAVWLDSWHSAPAWMTFAGSRQASGTISLMGSYSVPPGPDWGWGIQLEGTKITMHNLIPDRPPYQVVLLELQKESQQA